MTATIRTLDITSFATGAPIPFRVLLIPAGVQSPASPTLAPSDVATVEFYDRRYAGQERFGAGYEHGQFTAGRYNLDTLLGVGPYSRRIGGGHGLDLYGGESSWTLDAAATERVVLWLDTDGEPHVSITDPDDPMGMPAYDGPLSGASARLVPGAYPASTEGQDVTVIVERNCERCGSEWGGDATCGRCTDDDGTARPVPADGGTARLV